MNELDRIAGLYVIPLAALFFSVVITIIGIICFVYLRASQQTLKEIRKTVEFIKAQQKTFERDQGKRYSSVESSMQELNHEHELFERFLTECKKLLEKIEANTSEVKEKQATYLSKNSNEANGNKVKITTGEKKPEIYSAELVNAMITQLIDRIQKNPPNP